MNLGKLDLFIQTMVSVTESFVAFWIAEEMLSVVLQHFPLAYLNYQRGELLWRGGGVGKMQEEVDSVY